MTKRARIIVLLLFVVLCVAAWLALRPSHEPLYKGRPYSEWLGGITLDGASAPDGYVNAIEAIRVVGTNAIPTLLGMLRAEDTPLKIKFHKFVRKKSYFKTQDTLATDLNYRAAFAFQQLGATASNAVPGLIRAYKKSRAPVFPRLFIIKSLGSIGPSAEPAVPILLEAASDATNIPVCSAALQALGQIHTQPASIVPFLVKHLRDGDPNLRMSAALGLSGFGRSAQSAVPALTNALTDGDWLVRANATNALKAIDPAAAAKFGIK